MPTSLLGATASAGTPIAEPSRDDTRPRSGAAEPVEVATGSSSAVLTRR